MGRSRSASWCGWIGPRRRHAARSRRPVAPWRRRCRARKPAPQQAGRRLRSMLQAAANAFRLPDVRRKLLFTFGILVVYRAAAAIPVPSFDRTAFAQLLQQNNLFQLLSLFAGGSGQISIVMLGVYPYITAQIAIQILQPVIPRLEELMREGGEAGRQRLNQITRIVTVPLAMLQALGQGALLASAGAIKDFGLFNARTALPTLAFLITTAAGTMFLIWLGELITENGIGNGVSIIIFAGIIARVPSLVGSEVQNNVGIIVIMAIVSALVIAAIVFVQEAQPRIPVQHAKRVLETRQKHGGFIPGYRPGQQTAIYLTRVVNRVTSAGALFLGAVALLPYIGRLLLNTPVNLTISATALLIIVGVVIDTMRQLEAQLMMRNYQSFIK